MKKLTNWELSTDIVKKALCTVRLIAEIETLKVQAGSRAKKSIDIYDTQLELIKASNWANHEAKGTKWFFRTFRKGYLTNFNDRLTDDITVLSEYQESLVEAINSNEYHDYEIFENDILIDGGEFKNMDDAITAVQFCDNLKEGRYYKIVGNNETATFYNEDGKFEEVKTVDINANDLLKKANHLTNLLNDIDDLKEKGENLKNDNIISLINHYTFTKESIEASGIKKIYIPFINSATKKILKDCDNKLDTAIEIMTKYRDRLIEEINISKDNLNSWNNVLNVESKKWLKYQDTQYYVDKVTELWKIFKFTSKYDKKIYRYTYKLRGYSIGCQPMTGLKEVITSTSHKFEILEYDRELTVNEINNYELIALN
jgi:hypothetical protein